MPTPSMTGKVPELFTFMKEQGYPIFHMSNIFLRDIEYGIRDYYRVTTKKDIGTRESRRLAQELVAHLLKNNLMSPLGEKTWLLNMPEFLNKPKEEAKEAAPAAAPAA